MTEEGSDFAAQTRTYACLLLLTCGKCEQLFNELFVRCAFIQAVVHDVHGVRVRADGIRSALQLSNVSVFVRSIMQFDLYHLTSLAGWVESNGSSAAVSMAAVKVPARR